MLRERYTITSAHFVYGESAYRFGFNGMEDMNITDKFGEFYNTDFRVYDSRLCRWLSIDPWTKKYPWQSPYVAFDNNPIIIIDPSSLGGEDVIKDGDKDKFKEVKGSDGNIIRISSGATVMYYPSEQFKDRVFSFSYKYTDDSRTVTRTFKAKFNKNNKFEGYNEVKSGKKYESGGFFKDETKAYDYMWKSANNSQTEMTALITENGVYVGPNAFNDEYSSWKGYQTEVKDNKLYVNGALVIGQMHTHQQVIDPSMDGGFSSADIRNSKTLLGAPQLYMAWDGTVSASFWPTNSQTAFYWTEFNNKKISTTDLTRGKVKLINMLKKFKP